MDLLAQLRASLTTQHLPTPSTAFLTSLATARTPPPPLPSLLATAKARLLACDLAQGALLDPALPSLPPAAVGARAAETRELRLPRDVHVQVVDVENLSLSRWEQIEELEAIDRGECTRGRQVVRVAAAADDDGGNQAEVPEGQTQTQTQTQARSRARPQPQPQRGAEGRATGKNATHRLVLQDCKGAKVFAVELRRMDKIGVGRTSMGEKMLLKAGTVVARGTVLLEPEKCLLLGGRVEAWQKTWLEGRLARLREAVGASAPQ